MWRRYQRYQTERSIMMSQCGASGVHERMLVHGSGKFEPLRISTDSDGFMAEVGNEKAFYGQCGAGCAGPSVCLPMVVHCLRLPPLASFLAAASFSFHTTPLNVSPRGVCGVCSACSHDHSPA